MNLKLTAAIGTVGLIMTAFAAPRDWQRGGDEGQAWGDNSYVEHEDVVSHPEWSEDARLQNFETYAQRGPGPRPGFDRGPGHGPGNRPHDDRGPGGPPPRGPHGPRHEAGPEGDHHHGPPRGPHGGDAAHGPEGDHRDGHRGPPPPHGDREHRPEPARFADHGPQRADHRRPEGHGHASPVVVHVHLDGRHRGQFGPPPFARGPMGGGMPFGPGGRPGMRPQGFGPGHGPNPMAMLDADHDGKITKEEVLKHFAELDANDDDAVTVDELQNHMRAHRPEGGPGRGPQAGPPRGEHRPGPPHRPEHPGAETPKKPEVPQKSDEPAKTDETSKQAEVDFAPADAMSVIPAV